MDGFGKTLEELTFAMAPERDFESGAVRVLSVPTH